MLSIFKKLRDKQPPRHPPVIDNIRRTLFKNIEMYKTYWQNMNWTVRSDHVLMRVLNKVTLFTEDNLLNYNAAERALEGFVSSIGFITPVFYGRVQPKPHFYGEGCQEILIDQRFDDSVELMMMKHYTEWDPIRVVRHPFTSFDYQIANGKKRRTGEKGIVIIKIDLALLCVQYHCWLMDRMRNRYENDELKPMGVFLHNVPITNMIESHTEVVWYNRFMNYCLNEPNNDDRGDQRLMLVTSYTHLDEFYRRLYDNYVRSRADFYEWICWLPGLYTKNYREFIAHDFSLRTHQNKLSFALIEYPALCWLFQLEHRVKTGADTLYRNEYLKTLREYKNNRTFGTIRGLSIYDLETLFDEKITEYVNTV